MIGVFNVKQINNNQRKNIMKKISKLLILSLYLMFSSFSCLREGKRDESLDDKLTLKRINYTGNELRIDGYYYNIYYNDKKEPQGITPLFFYRNGIILGDVGVRIDKISEMEEWFRNGYYVNNAEKYQWGVFQIDGTKIKYEKWVPVQGPFVAVTYEGVILNNTTFVINQSYKMEKGNRIDLSKFDWTYHFKEFSPKPDSTNRFIK